MTEAAAFALGNSPFEFRIAEKTIDAAEARARPRTTKPDAIDTPAFPDRIYSRRQPSRFPLADEFPVIHPIAFLLEER